MATYFKYANANGIGFMLEQGTLCFTSVSALNDVSEAGWNFQGYREKTVRKILIDLLTQLEPGTLWSTFRTSEIREAFLSKTNYSLDYLNLKCQKIGWQVIQKKFASFGVLSLTTSSINFLLWSH